MAKTLSWQTWLTRQRCPWSSCWRAMGMLQGTPQQTRRPVRKRHPQVYGVSLSVQQLLPDMWAKKGSGPCV